MSGSKKTYNLFQISEARNVLFGIATLWIGFFHSKNLLMSFYTSNPVINYLFHAIKGSGNVGVDMFLFLSGIGLYFSFVKDSRVLSFWKRRLIRILPTAFVIAACYYSLRYATYPNGPFNDSGLGVFLSRMTFTFFFWKGERVFWFISLILLLYLLFPLFYKVIVRFRLIGALLLIALAVAITFLFRRIFPEQYSLLEIAVCRIPVFIVGIWAGRFVMEKKEISRRWLWLFLVAAVVSLLCMRYYSIAVEHFVPGYDIKTDEAMYLWIYRYAGSVLGVSLVFLLSFVCMSLRKRGRCKWISSFFAFVGMYSMEYYMIYANIAGFLNRVYRIEQRHQVMLYFGCFVITLILCVAVRKFCDFFMRCLQKPTKSEEKNLQTDNRTSAKDGGKAQ